MQKISLFHLFLLEIQSILKFPDQTGNTHSWTFYPKNVQSTLIFCEFLSISFIYCGDIVIYKSYNLTGWEHFGPYLTANNINFHYKTISGKLMTKFFSKLKKPIFWQTFAPFSQFWRQKFFQKIWLCHTTSSGSLATC